jgi:dipeptidyl aminopeptidase/acylaminoacyl peptidase
MTHVWRQDGAMKLPVQLTGGEDNTSVAGLAPDDSFVVVSRDVGGQENPGLYLLDPNGGPLKLIQHKPKVQTSLAFIADDSKSLYFSANDIKDDSYAIYRYDVTTGTRDLVFDTPGLWRVSDHRGDDWLLIKNLGNTQQEVYSYSVTSKALTPLLGQNEVEEYSAEFGAKPGQVLVRTNKLGEFQRVYSLEGATLTPISADVKFDVQGFGIDDARKRIYISTNEAGYSTLSALDARTLKPLKLPTLPKADHVSAALVSRDGRFVQLIVSGAQLPHTMVVDLRRRRTG